MNIFTISDIPGLLQIINNVPTGTDSSVETFEKYYSVTEYSTKLDDKYKIIKYNKDLLSSDLIGTYGLLRSVIINSENKVVSFAPPKSVLTEDFFKKFSKKTEDIIAQDFVEGTMINVFYDHKIQCWKIATRNTIDAEVSFYKNNITGTKETGKTFKKMFEEACKENNLIIDTLNPQFCYSFVLQHPDNRIVVPFKRPQLYLVEVYEIIQLEQSVNIITQNLSLVRSHGSWNMTSIRFPETYEFTTYSELIDKFASANTPYDIMGIVIKNLKTNERTKIRNPIYEEVRHLKGNHPKLQYQYLHLRKNGKLPEYLKYYPENKKSFAVIRDKVHLFTNTLHTNYLACYVKKEKPLNEYEAQYKTHMYKIHEIYKNELIPSKLFVTNTIVQKYVNNLEPALLFYSMKL